ncbi:hypothetical protein [Sinorhizobium sp. BG8]|uniref:hypothetical protein n=1 Tax=Sinorhizobium sp. BG8 TaxID=2613773 RepID=UPI00193D4C21|nr:hypothetical protein [Sinorhizobium sp. BG8]QRM56678.1 hypothetical protein F3Y30_20680 [Sinorhizobium sp. BG8]
MSNVELFSQNELAADEAELLKAAFEAEALSGPIEAMPWLLRSSGLYKWSSLTHPTTNPVLGGVEAALEAEVGSEALSPIVFQREELRLDVDGNYPQMTASGTLYRSFVLRVHWIANLVAVGPRTWTGTIWYKDGSVASFPYTSVKITAVRSLFASGRSATVTFSGGGALPRRRTYRFASNYFHPAEFEYDHESGVVPDLDIDTCAHPNRPATLPCQVLTTETIYRRAGFDATRNPAISDIPTDGPDVNLTWSDAEMHDAMQTYWSRFANKPQWALWVLFAKQHDIGPNLGGIMFDDIGPNHRQGTAIFYDSFISNAPAGDPAPAAAVKRLHFWTAIHEMGHAFNLAHSWQKDLGTPWIPLAAEPEARSFMNYPYFVAGGETAFFSNFEYRFTDSELLFLRHAPERFVQMGNADWFDHHGFEGASTLGANGFDLEIGVDRAKPIYDFLEPVVLEIKLTNISAEPKIVPSDILLDTGGMVVILKKAGKPARQWLPYAHQCRRAAAMVLQPGQEITESLFVSAGVNGWDLAEPGHYTVQMSMQINGADLLSNELQLRVAPPKSYEEEYVAQGVYTDEGGRVMAFDGSLVLDAGRNAWLELVERLPNSRAAAHARIALALPMTRNYRLLRIDAPEKAMAIDGRAAFAVAKKRPEEAAKHLEAALVDEAEVSATTLGRVDFEYYGKTYADWLKDSGADKEAKQVGDTVRKVAAKLARHHPAPKSQGAHKVAAE